MPKSAIPKSKLNRTSYLVIRTFLLLLATFCFQSTYSQYFQSTNYKEGSGLPSSESYMAYQDSKGFIWIGTDNGVVKFDGHEFVTYNITTGLTDNTVFGFYEDYKNRMWFRTYNGALSYFENDSIKTYKYNTQLKSAIASSILLAIYPDSLDNLYFGAALHAITGKISADGDLQLMTKKSAYGNVIQYVDDEILTGTSGIPLNMTSITINDSLFSIKLDDPARQSNAIVVCARWKDLLYFAIHKNLFRYDGKSVVKVYTSRENFISLYVDHEDRLWAGYFSDGVEVFADESLTNPFTVETLANLSVSNVLHDREEGIWVTTLDQGAFYFPNLTVSNYKHPTSSKISAVSYADETLFLGNYDGEVFSLDARANTRIVHKGVPPVSHLFIDQGGELWISDAAGTLIYPTKQRIGEQGGPSIAFKGLVDAGDHVLGYNSMGIFRLSHTGKVLEKLSTRKRPSAMVVAGDDIFLGGVNGLEVYDLNFAKDARRVTGSRISALKTVDERYVFIGTTGEGLQLYDRKTNKLTTLNIADVANVYSIIGEGERVWIGTDKGLFQVDLHKGDTLAVDHFTKAAGLISSKINTVCRMNNRILAVSDLGISSVPLEHFSERNYIPAFYPSRILFKNQVITGNVRQVDVEAGGMVIDVRAITFKGYPVEFRYRLNGEPWLSLAGGSIFLSDLRPGRYELEIQASSGNDDWTKSHPLTINVVAAWWETWAFRLSAVAAILLIGYGAYRLRINAIRRKHKYLELINLHQQKLIDSEIATQERERKRIATDLHDGIGASLSSIKMQITDAASNEPSDLPIRGKEIADNLSDVIDDIKRIVYDLHPPGLERYGLQTGLKNLVDRLNKSTDVNVIFDYYGQRDVVHPVSITIFRIIQELINNTLKHARASEIRIHINEFDDEINIMYEDNGIGMIGSRFTGLGLHSIESRVRSLDGRMSWESNHKGTFYSFDIPF